MNETDWIDPAPTADRMAAEIDRNGGVTQKCLTVRHAESVAHELRQRGYTASSSGDVVSAS